MKSISLGVIVTVLFGISGIAVLAEPEPKHAGTYTPVSILHKSDFIRVDFHQTTQPSSDLRSDAVSSACLVLNRYPHAAAAL